MNKPINYRDLVRAARLNKGTAVQVFDEAGDFLDIGHVVKFVRYNDNPDKLFVEVQTSMAEQACYPIQDVTPL